MSKSTVYLTLIFLFASTGLFAQLHKCGVDVHMGAMIKDQLLQDRNEMRDYVHVRSAVVYLPIRFILVARSDGSERVTETKVLQALCNLNNNFADQEIQFYIDRIDYFNNSTVHSNPMSNIGFNTISGQMEYDAINIFLVEEAGGGAAAYFQPPAGAFGNDWIVCGESYADDFETLTHEVGHFFALEHPFYGWEESGGWSEAEHGNPVDVNSPSGMPNELADGSNCEDAGDMVCDTPADYMFPFPGPDGCTYNLNVMDPTGALINPDITNFMNYGACSNDDYHFTDGQKEVVQNSLNSSSRNYIPKNYVPNLNEVTSSPTTITPQNLETVETYNSVYLEWTSVPNAESYLLEVVSSTDGSTIMILDNTSVLLTDLSPESNYFWKVTAFSEYSTCQGPSSQRIFKTGSDTVSDTNEIAALADWSLTPNPIRSGNMFNINIESTSNLTLDVNISTVTGQLVSSLKEQVIANGTTSLEIDTNELPAGMYLVSLHTDNGIMTKRISIL